MGSPDRDAAPESTGGPAPAAGAPPRPRGVARLLRRIALSLGISVVLCVLVVEAASRIADGVVARRKAEPGFDGKTYKPDLWDSVAVATIDPAGQKLEDARTVPHPYLGYALKASWSTQPGARIQCSHNSLGFRGKETTWEKPEGVFRIVTSGGSSVYGQSETSDAAVWSQRLEDDLNDAGLPKHIEVINGGCLGYSSFENLINFETRLVDFDPDLLIQYEAINDMRCALYTRGGEIRRDNTQWRQPWPVVRPSALEHMLEYTRVYLVWRFYCTDYFRQRDDLGFYAIVNYSGEGDPYDPDPVPDLGFENYRRNLVDLIAAAKAHGTQVLLVTQALPRYHLDGMPSKAKQLAGIDRIQAIEREVGQARKVPVFECAKIIDVAIQQELDREIARQKQLDPWAKPSKLDQKAKAVLHPWPMPLVLDNVLFRYEVHPFDLGSDLIARTIADYLLESDLLPKKER